MDNNNQQRQRDEYLRHQLDQAGAFEEMVKTKGWETLLAYYKARVQQFATELLLMEDKPIEHFEPARRELIGLRKLMGQVEESLRVLNDYRKGEKEGKDGGQP